MAIITQLPHNKVICSICRQLWRINAASGLLTAGGSVIEGFHDDRLGSSKHLLFKSRSLYPSAQLTGSAVRSNTSRFSLVFNEQNVGLSSRLQSQLLFMPDCTTSLFFFFKPNKHPLKQVNSDPPAKDTFYYQNNHTNHLWHSHHKHPLLSPEEALLPVCRLSIGRPRAWPFLPMKTLQR